MARIKRVKVTLLGLQNILTGSDPGNNLEVSGRLVAYLRDVTPQGLVTKRYASLWDVSNPISIAHNQFIPINKSEEFYIQSGQLIQIGGSLTEWDTLYFNDRMSNSLTRTFEAIVGTHYDDVHFAEGDQLIFARYEIKRLASVADWVVPH